MNLRLLSLLIGTLAGFSLHSTTDAAEPYLKHNETAPATTLRVSNNYPFPVREAVQFHLSPELAQGADNLLAVSHSVSGGTVEAHYLPIQLDENTGAAWIDVQLRPDESRRYTFQNLGGNSPERTPATVTDTFPSGLPATIAWSPDLEVALFDLLLAENESPTQVAFELETESHGPVKSHFVYRSDHGILVTYDLFSSGITDLEIRLQTDRSIPSIAKRIALNPDATTFAQSGGDTFSLDDRKSSSSDQPVNWISWENRAGETSHAILALATPGATEIAAESEDGWVLLSEINAEEAVNPTLNLRYRVLPAKARSIEETNQAFISFAGFQGRTINDGEFHVQFGVPGVAFGAAYSPHTTVGKNWHRFQEEIRRDLRIANAIGLNWIRIQKVNAPDPQQNFLTTDAGKWMLDYLAFMTEAAAESGLNVFLSCSLSSDDARLVAQRFGTAIGFYEVESGNAAQAAAIKAVQPDASLAIVGAEPSAASFGAPAESEAALDALGLESPRGADAIALGGHAGRAGKLPIASGDAWRRPVRKTEQAQATQLFRLSDNLLSRQNTALLLASNLATLAPNRSPGDDESLPFELLRLDRTPTIQAQALHEIIRRYGRDDNGIKTLEISMPLLRLRPGSRETLPVTVKNLTSQTLEIRLTAHLPDGITTDSQTETISLRPRQTRTYQRNLQTAEDFAPGFHPIFEEAQFGDAVRFGWTYAAHRGAPALDLEAAPAEGVRYAEGLESLQAINLANIRHVAFGSDAPAREANAALLLRDSLRAATGADIHAWPHAEMTTDQRERSIVLIGTPETNPLIANIAERLPINPRNLDSGEGVVMVVPQEYNPARYFLIISGKDAIGTGKAAADLLSRL